MLPKYGHQKNLTPLAGALMIFADCYGGAARGLQPAFSLPAGFPLRARVTCSTKLAMHKSNNLQIPIALAFP